MRGSVSFQLLVSRRPCLWRQWTCFCTAGGKASSCAFQLLLLTKPSLEGELAETALSHTPNLNPEIHLNEHRKEPEDSVTPVHWRIIFSKLGGECQELRLQVSTCVFTLRRGSAGVQALQIPGRWFQSTSTISSIGDLNVGRISHHVWKPKASLTVKLIKKNELLGESLEDRLNWGNLSHNPFLIWRIKVMSRTPCV